MTKDNESPVTEELLQAIRQADPYRHIVIPGPAVTPAQLRMRAEQSAEAQKSWHDRFLTGFKTRRMVLAGLAAIGVTAAAYLLAPSPAFAAPGHLDIDFSGPADPAGDWLVQLARSLAAQPQTNGAHRTTYAHLQRWSMDTIHPASELIAQDSRIWWNTDRSGTELLTELPPQPTGRNVAEYLNDLPPGAKQDKINYPPGEYSSLIDTPSTDVAELKSQLDTNEPASNGPQARVRSIGSVTAIHHLSAAQRIAVLTVLADVPGLLFRGPTKDRAGRPCAAITIDSGDTGTGLKRDILLIDMTGTVIGYELVALTPPPRSPISNDTVIEYSLSLKTEHVG